MRILSADGARGSGMSKILKSEIKRLVKENSGVILNDKAANALVEILERKARDIAQHAVRNAAVKNRNVILEEDIEDYSVKYGG
jgi:histone H3/H4